MVRLTRKLRRDPVNELFSQMQNMVQEISDMGEEMTGMPGNMPVDIREEDGEIVVTADMPGVQKEDINLTADEEGVEIMAESSEEIHEENEKYMRKERTSRSFMRTIQWPKPVDTDSITAEYDDGVLEIRAEAEEDEGTQIEIH